MMLRIRALWFLHRTLRVDTYRLPNNTRRYICIIYFFLLSYASYTSVPFRMIIPTNTMMATFENIDNIFLPILFILCLRSHLGSVAGSFVPSIYERQMDFNRFAHVFIQANVFVIYHSIPPFCLWHPRG